MFGELLQHSNIDINKMEASLPVRNSVLHSEKNHLEVPKIRNMIKMVKFD